MKVAIVGTGYVGLVTGACLAEQGHHVICVDRDQTTVRRLKQGVVSFYEPGLQDLVNAGIDSGCLEFASSAAFALNEVDIVFVAVGTPPGDDGTPDLSALDTCVSTLATHLREDVILVLKSTVPPGTNERVQAIFDTACHERGALSRVTVVSNPEFLAEGQAVHDFRHPDRIVIGTDRAWARERMAELYQPFDPSGSRTRFMSARSAELSKYACNAMLAARVALVNELARIAGCIDADMASVRDVMASDPRIGPHYLQAGVGFGGSCLPKDLQCLMHTARLHDAPTPTLEGVARSNELQCELLADTVAQSLGGNLRQARIAIWGLSFKPDTDDTRSSPSLALICRLLAAGAHLRAYDPAAMPVCAQKLNHPRLMLAPDAMAACDGADLLVVMTPWKEFRAPDFAALREIMNGTTILDGSNIYEASALEAHGFSHRLPWQRPGTVAELHDQAEAPLHTATAV